MTEDEIVDSDLLQDVFPEETEWVSHSPLQTDQGLPSTPVSLQFKPLQMNILCILQVYIRITRLIIDKKIQIHDTGRRLFSVLNYSVMRGQCCNVFLQTADSPDDLLQKRMVVLKGVLTSEEIYLTELETLLTVICSDSNRTLTYIRQWLDGKYSSVWCQKTYFPDCADCELESENTVVEHQRREINKCYF